MWPFNSKKKYLAWLDAQPMPRCGDKKEHYFWTEDGWPCPTCTAIRDNARNIIKDRERVDAIAKRVVELLRQEQQESH